MAQDVATKLVVCCRVLAAWANELETDLVLKSLFFQGENAASCVEIQKCAYHTVHASQGVVTTMKMVSRSRTCVRVWRCALLSNSGKSERTHSVLSETVVVTVVGPPLRPGRAHSQCNGMCKLRSFRQSARSKWGAAKPKMCGFALRESASSPHKNKNRDRQTASATSLISHVLAGFVVCWGLEGQPASKSAGLSHTHNIAPPECEGLERIQTPRDFWWSAHARC